MEKCKQCNKISYSLTNGLCKKCSKISNSTIDKCTKCKKITVYRINDLCVQCLKTYMPKEELVNTLFNTLKLKDPKELSSLTKLSEKEILKISEKLGLKGMYRYKCHKCNKYIKTLGLCNSCHELYTTLKSIDHLKKLRKISNDGEVSLHDKTK